MMINLIKNYNQKICGKISKCKKTINEYFKMNLNTLSLEKENED